MCFFFLIRSLCFSLLLSSNLRSMNIACNIQEIFAKCVLLNIKKYHSVVYLKHSLFFLYNGGRFNVNLFFSIVFSLFLFFLLLCHTVFQSRIMCKFQSNINIFHSWSLRSIYLQLVSFKSYYHFILCFKNTARDHCFNIKHLMET